MTERVLVDSNVMVAMVIDHHQHHETTRAFLRKSMAFSGAAHSFAEAYNTLTRTNASAQYRTEPLVAWRAIDRLRKRIAPIGLTPTETLDAVQSFAASGGIGPRLYDRLIGEVALRRGISVIVTWNTGHFQSLFPALRVGTPEDFA